MLVHSLALARPTLRASSGMEDAAEWGSNRFRLHLEGRLSILSWARCLPSHPGKPHRNVARKQQRNVMCITVICVTPKEQPTRDSNRVGSDAHPHSSRYSVAAGLRVGSYASRLMCEWGTPEFDALPTKTAPVPSCTFSSFMNSPPPVDAGAPFAILGKRPMGKCLEWQKMLVEVFSTLELACGYHKDAGPFSRSSPFLFHRPRTASAEAELSNLLHL